MLRKLVVAVLVAGSLVAVNPAPALAAAPTGDCAFHSVQQDDATGQNYEGVITAYAIDPDGRPISVRCYVTVNGTEVSSSPTGSGVGFAAATGRITFSAGDTDVVHRCIVIYILGVEVFRICW